MTGGGKESAGLEEVLSLPHHRNNRDEAHRFKRLINLHPDGGGERQAGREGGRRNSAAGDQARSRCACYINKLLVSLHFPKFDRSVAHRGTHGKE